jgi:hypothetical protein
MLHLEATLDQRFLDDADDEPRSWEKRPKAR